MQNYTKLTPTQRKKQAWLNRYPFLKAEYDSFHNQIEEEINRTQRLTSTVSLAPVRTGKKTDDIWVDVFDNIDKTVKYFESVQEDVMDAMRDIEHSISMIEDEDQKSIMILHYLENLPFKEIAKRLPISERMIYYYHSTALENLMVPEHVLKS